MRNFARRAPILGDLPPLVRSTLSFDGQLVDTSQEIWRFRSSLDGGKIIALDWAQHKKARVLSPHALNLLRLYFADRIARKKARTIENDFRMFLRLQKWLYSHNQPLRKWTDLTEGLVRAFLQHGIEQTADKGNDFSRLRTFYRWGVARQYSDFDPAFLEVLRSIIAVGNAKGHSVRFRDTVRGPFSTDELMLIAGAVRDGLGSSRDRAIVMLHLELGHNPDASVRLRNSDLIRYQTPQQSYGNWMCRGSRSGSQGGRPSGGRSAMGSVASSVACSRAAPTIHFSVGYRSHIPKAQSPWRCGGSQKQPILSRRGHSCG
jgi:hypothetical protein